MTVVRDQLFPQKPPGSRFRFSRTGVQPSPGSSTIELPSAFAESGAYPPDREPPGSPRQCSLPLACRHPPEGHQIGARKRRTHENTILSQPYCRRVSTDRSDREGSQLAASLEGEPGPTPAGKTLPHSYPETRFRRERARDCCRTRTITAGLSGCCAVRYRHPEGFLVYGESLSMRRKEAADGIWIRVCMYVCMVITYSRVWINRVRLPILLVVS